jgi:methylmalonyl-CoA/ethylmalonyl-CoA epimerase
MDMSGFGGKVTFDHTALAVHSIDSVLPLYRDFLGGKVKKDLDRRNKGYRSVTLVFPNGNQLELLEPAGEESFLRPFLEKRGEGPHHLTFLVPDVRQAVEAARAAGFRVVGESYDSPTWHEAFLSPRENHGTLVQLATPLTKDGEG